MKTFSSFDELKNYLAANSAGRNLGYSGGPVDAKFFGGERSVVAPSPAPAETAPQSTAADSGSYSVDSHSTTNIQVAGVDEADVVKNDGRYIYVAANDYSTNNIYSMSSVYSTPQTHVYILKADPQDPRIISKITLENNTYLAGIFLSQDSSRLVILASQYQTYAYDAWTMEQKGMLYRSDVNTFVNVYDISDKAYPVLARNFTISGSYFNSRMIGDYVYAVVSQQAYVLQSGELPLPMVYAGTAASVIAPTSIYYSDTAKYADTSSNYFTYTTFVGLNILDDAQKPTNMTVMMGGASTMYVSVSNIYVTYPTYSEQGQYTSIYRVSVNGNALAFEAKGSVPGYVLNQYSMDEYNGNFRLATTWQGTTQMNNVYVLNMNLTTVGKVENIAEKERIYSARFMGDKAYLVTFRQMDPFFVLDMRDPANPKVAGELKIPGYSSYLHPYDENHVIGLGMESSAVKLSLFDVTNVNAPTEIAKYTVQGDYSSSDALYEPKAFLFDKEKQLLVIPISLQLFGPIASGTVDPSGKQLGFSTQGYFWQGAYVFKLTVTGGFELRGAITQQETSTTEKPYPMFGIDYNLYVNRALYIGNTLYTISNAKVKLNSLTDLTQIAEIKLS
jgi:uncharacterized secreted protein with C-terminal beta-propeller domain